MRTIKFTLAFLFMLAAIGSCALSAHAAERWTRAAVADEVAITVLEVSSIKLASLQGVTDMHAIIDQGSRESRFGYAELRRNRATGAYSCTIYVTKDVTEETLAHELRHCHGWVHP